MLLSRSGRYMTTQFLKQTVCFLALIGLSRGQMANTALPTEPGMYIELNGACCSKIIGQIAEFKRSGSLLVSDMTAGIKTKKENIQLLGAHAQTVVSPQPVFYFVPAKQEADTGVNAGDLILIRLEEKAKRRQFEIAAYGAWRRSSGISLTHQVELLRSEARPGVYKVMPATELEKGEYALYLSRGEGMAAYVYDFGVQQLATKAGELSSLRVTNSQGTRPKTDGSATPPSDSPTPQLFKSASIGAYSQQDLDVRHDGVTLTSVVHGGPADQVGMAAGDVILAIDDHYLFTVREFNDEIAPTHPGTKIMIRYRRYSLIYEVPIVVTENPK